MDAYFADIPGLPANVNSSLRAFAESVSGMAEAVFMYDAAGGILFCNASLMRLFGMTSVPLGRPVSEVLGRESVPFSDKPLPHSVETTLTVSGGALCRCNVLFLPHKVAGCPFVLCVLTLLATGVATESGRVRNEEALVGHNRELLRLNTQLRIENAERSAVVQALRRAESRYRSIFDNAVEGIFQWTSNWRLLSANIAFARMMGHSTVNALFASVAEKPFHFCNSPSSEKELLAELERKGHITNFEFQVVRHDGSVLWASMHARRVSGPGGYTRYYEAFIENISSRKQTEEKLVYQAFHDPLTGLANRSLFLDRLKMALRRATRQPNYGFAILYLDLDRFKIVNDTYGHTMGDDVLCHAAVSILSCVREVDTVARFGGDEFAVLLEETEHSSVAVRIAKRIRAALCEPFVIREQEINIGASIGIVLKAERYELSEDILRDADAAMYKAKADRRNGFRVFNRKMREESLESVVFETDLRQGMQSKEFFLDYQPIMHMGAGTLHGFEALLRWKRKGEVISPTYFIPVAEDNGLIHSLGLHMIEQVCFQMAQWKREYAKPFVTHVNISGRQLIFPSFPKEVQRILERTAVDPSCLIFEITENVLLDNGGACIQGIKQIRDLGIQFCLDDFGTGFSSLSYLRQLPLACIKVDRSFAIDVDTDSHALVIVRNLLTLGQDLGLAVIVEGIEREAQVEALLSAGCTLAQGYYFSRPLTVSGAQELLTK